MNMCLSVKAVCCDGTVYRDSVPLSSSGKGRLIKSMFESDLIDPKDIMFAVFSVDVYGRLFEFTEEYSDLYKCYLHCLKYIERGGKV